LVAAIATSPQHHVRRGQIASSPLAERATDTTKTYPLGQLEDKGFDLTAGKGWLAIVAIIAGKWLPKGVFIAVLVFAFLGSVAVHVQILDVNIPYQIFLALPYLASIILLICMRKKINQPAKLGVPYFR
jgi:ABC-type uncharacterized transport system permease subunit